MIHISFLPEELFSFAGISITNSLILSYIALAILLVFGFLSSKNVKLIPKGKSLQSLVEVIIEALFNLIQGVTGDRKETRNMFPLVATIFLFVLVSNWLGLIPGVGTIGLIEVTDHGKIMTPLLRSPSADLNFTLAIAVVSVLATQLFGIAALGFFKYSKKFLNFSSPVMFFVGLFELVGEVAKIISFSFRLFGNVFAGEVLLTVIICLAPLIAPLPFYALEVAVGVIQAFIFAMLTVVFIKMATLQVEH